jgi:hypothetical protein
MDVLLNSSAKPAGKQSWLRRRWVRRLLAAVVVLGILAAAYRPLLRGVAEFLIVDSPAGRADYLVLLPATLDSGVEAEEAARRYIAGDVGGILLFKPPMSRAVRCRAWPDRATELCRDLARLGVPAAAIIVPPEPCRTSWDAAHAIQHWLQKRPETRLLVMDRLLRGRYDRRIFNTVLDARQAAALQFTALRSGVDENNWWHSREGIQLIFQNYGELAFDWCSGQSEPCKDPWILEDFERSLPAPTDH